MWQFCPVCSELWGKSGSKTAQFGEHCFRKRSVIVCWGLEGQLWPVGIAIFTHSHATPYSSAAWTACSSVNAKICIDSELQRTQAVSLQGLNPWEQNRKGKRMKAGMRQTELNICFLFCKKKTMFLLQPADVLQITSKVTVVQDKVALIQKALMQQSNCSVLNSVMKEGRVRETNELI